MVGQYSLRKLSGLPVLVLLPTDMYGAKEEEEEVIG